MKTKKELIDITNENVEELMKKYPFILFDDEVMVKCGKYYLKIDRSYKRQIDESRYANIFGVYDKNGECVAMRRHDND